MKNLLIIGARGYGRGVCDIASDMNQYGKEFIIKGFLDDKTDALCNYPNYPPIISSVEEYQIQENDVFVCALGDVEYKKKYVNIILQKGGDFYNIIHPTVHIGGNSKIGRGCIIGYNTNIDCDVTIGDFVNIQTNAVIGHDTIVGDWCMIDCFAFMGGFSVLEDSVTLHTRATIVPKIYVGASATINASSLVIRNVPSNSVMMGSPAKRMLIPNI